MSSAAHVSALPVVQHTIQELTNAPSHFLLCRPARLGCRHCTCPRLQGGRGRYRRSMVPSHSKGSDFCWRLYEDKKNRLNPRSTDGWLPRRRVKIRSARDKDEKRHRKDA